MLLDTPDCSVEPGEAVRIPMGRKPCAPSETNERESSTQHQISMATADQQMHQPALWDQHAEAQRIKQDMNELMTTFLGKMIACHSLTLPEQLAALGETVAPMALCLAESRSVLRRTEQMLAAARRARDYNALIAVALATEPATLLTSRQRPSRRRIFFLSFQLPGSQREPQPTKQRYKQL